MCRSSQPQLIALMYVQQWHSCAVQLGSYGSAIALRNAHMFTEQRVRKWKPQNNKPVKAPVMLVHYGKYCTWGVSRGPVQHSALPCAVLALSTRPSCNISRSALTPVPTNMWLKVLLNAELVQEINKHSYSSHKCCDFGNLVQSSELWVIDMHPYLFQNFTCV